MMLICLTRGTVAIDPASDFPSDYGILYKGLTWLLYAGLIFVAAMLLFRLAAASFAGLLFFGPTRRQLKDMDELNYFDVTWPDHRRRRFTFFVNMTLLLFAFLVLLHLWTSLEFQVSPRILSGKKAAIVFGYIVAINLYVLFNAWAFTPVRSEPNGPQDSEFLGQTSWMQSGTDKNGKPYSFRV